MKPATDGEAHALTLTAVVRLRSGRASRSAARFSVDTPGPQGSTPLLMVCKQGIVKSVQTWLDHGASPSQEGKGFERPEVDMHDFQVLPLTEAALHGHADIVKLLLSLDGVGVNDATSDTGCTALYCASFKGHVLVVEILRACVGVDVNKARADNGSTPLYIACNQGKIQCVKALLACDGIDVNKARTGDGATPLYTACFGRSTDIVKVLLAYDGIDVNMARTDDGHVTPLYIACADGHTAIVKLLLTYDDIDVNKARTADGATPLYAACYNGHTEIVISLLACDGIAVNKATTDDGITPLYVACFNGYTEIVKALLAYDDINVNMARTDDGATPFYSACIKGHTEIVMSLLAHDGIDVNKARTDTGSTPLYSACLKGHTEIVKVLLAHDGVDVNAVNTAGDTALHAAAWKGHLPTIQLLVASGANINIRTDVDNESVEQLALQYSNHDVVAWLQATAGWSPLKVAAACRLHTIVAAQLRKGSVDPDDPAATSPTEVLSIVQTAQMSSEALPWGNATPVCQTTIKLMKAATRGWSRTTHWLHHGGVRQAVHAMLRVAERLHRQQNSIANAPAAEIAASRNVDVDGDGDGDDGNGGVVDATFGNDAAETLPHLPAELWIEILGFVLRSWWAVPNID